MTSNADMSTAELLEQRSIYLENIREFTAEHAQRNNEVGVWDEPMEMGRHNAYLYREINEIASRASFGRLVDGLKKQ